MKTESTCEANKIQTTRKDLKCGDEDRIVRGLKLSQLVK